MELMSLVMGDTGEAISIIFTGKRERANSFFDFRQSCDCWYVVTLPRHALNSFVVCDFDIS